MLSATAHDTRRTCDGSQYVANIQTLVSRVVDPMHSAVVTVGKFIILVIASILLLKMLNWKVLYVPLKPKPVIKLNKG